MLMPYNEEGKCSEYGIAFGKEIFGMKLLKILLLDFI